MNHEQTVSVPKMIIFDCGHTLLHSPNSDILRGEQAVFEHIAKNPDNVTPLTAADLGQKLINQINGVREHNYEISHLQILRIKYGCLGIKLSIPLTEAEILLRRNASPGAVIPGAAEMLASLKEMHMRTAIITNTIWSECVIAERLRRLLPGVSFEFILASSMYGIRKPNRLLFDIALKKSGLNAKDVWYCGDKPAVDIAGASAAGLFPVWYTGYTPPSAYAIPTVPHLHINHWDEFVPYIHTL